jgi:energy-coupling factor transporter transmembrane protein EcfT
MNRAGRGLGTWSHLAFFLWALMMVALLPDGRLGLVLVAVVYVGLLDGGVGLRIVLRPRFWLFILSILALSPFILGEPDTDLWVLRLSWEGFVTGFWMALRALVLMLTFSTTVNALTISQLVGLFSRIGLDGLGFALGVAFNMIGVLQNLVASAYHSIRLRGGWRRPLRNAPLFLVTVTANALRHGDDVVKAAHARAFDPASKRTRPGNAPISQLDTGFIAGLLVVAVGLTLPHWT